MKRLLLGFLLALTCGLTLSSSAAAASSFSTLGAWSTNQTVGEFGYPNTATYGQVITVPGGETTLSSFLFEVNLPATTTFRAEVFAWGGSQATGSSLFESGDLSTGGTGWKAVVINTGSVPVVAGNQYVIFFTTSKSSGSATGIFGTTPDSTDPGGSFYYINNGTNPSQWTSNAWNNYGTDLAYSVGYGGVIVSAPGSGGNGTPAPCWNVLGDGGCAQLARGAVCSPEGRFEDVLLSQISDPSSPYYNLQPAAYVQGFGLVCSLSDIATYGGDPSAFVDAGYRVDETGARTPDGFTDASWNALYEFFAKKS